MRSFPLIVRIGIVLLLVSLVASSTATAKTLTDKQSGFRVNAPRGFSMKARSGVYTITNGRVFVRVMVTNAGAGAQTVGKASARAAGGKILRSSYNKRSRRYSADIAIGPKQYRLQVVDQNGGAVVSLMGKGRRPAMGRSTRAGRTRAGEFIGVADIARLAAIVNSRRGGTVIPLNVPFPSRVFQAPVNNGASAVVPNLPGWTYGGTDTGYLYGSHPRFASFELGGLALMNYPGSISPYPGIPSVSPTTPDSLLQALALSKAQQTNLQFQQVQIIAQGHLTSPISGMYLARFTANGRPGSGIFSVSNIDNGLAWYLYYSYIAIDGAAPGGTFDSLVNTWATWNNSDASRARLGNALRSVLTTQAGGGPIDQDVFEAANEKWSQYFRGPDA